MRHHEALWMVVGGIVVTYVVSAVVIYAGVCAFMEDTAPQ